MFYSALIHNIDLFIINWLAAKWNCQSFRRPRPRHYCWMQCSVHLSPSRYAPFRQWLARTAAVSISVEENRRLIHWMFKPHQAKTTDKMRKLEKKLEENDKKMKKEWRNCKHLRKLIRKNKKKNEKIDRRWGIWKINKVFLNFVNLFHSSILFLMFFQFPHFVSCFDLRHTDASVVGCTYRAGRFQRIRWHIPHILHDAIDESGRLGRQSGR